MSFLILGKGYAFDDCLPCKWWDNKTRIDYIQRRVIIYSILYYQMSESILFDAQFDCISNQLVRLMKETPQSVLEKTRYWYCMYDFDGSTGFDLPSKLNPEDYEQLRNLAGWIKAHKGGMGEK